MATDAELTGILDSMATYALSEMGTAVLGTTTGIKKAWGWTTPVPEAHNGLYPVLYFVPLNPLATFKWEAMPNARIAQAGRHAETYKVAGVLVLAARERDLRAVRIAAFPWPMRYLKAFALHLTLGGTVSDLSTDACREQIIQWGGQQYYALIFEHTITTRTQVNAGQ